MPRLVYADASALVKLVIEEAESEALLRFVSDEVSPASSVVAAVEVPRAVQRAGEPPAAVERANRLVEEIDLVGLDANVIAGARSVVPAAVRSLDAIHIASALALGDELSAFVVYDRRLQRAAEDAGLTAIAPGT